MPLETGDFISDLVPTNPVGSTDFVSEGDDHLRLIKHTIQTTFPNVDGAVNFTPAQANHLANGNVALLDASSVEWDGWHAFGGSSATKLRMLRTGSPTDQGMWQWNIASSGALELWSRNDAGGAGDQVLLATRDGTDVPSLTLAADDITLDGDVTIDGNVSLDGGNTTVATTGTSTFIVGSGGTVSLRGGTGGEGAAFQINSGTTSALIRAGGVGGGNTVATFAADGITLDGDVEVNGETTFDARIILQGTGTDLAWTHQTGAPAGTRRWRIQHDNNGDIVFSARDDDNSLAGTMFRIPHANANRDFIFGDDAARVDVRAPLLAPRTVRSTSATLVAGQVHARTANTTIPTFPGAPGSWVAIQNTGGSDITLTQGGGLTLTWTANGDTGSRTLRAYGRCVIWYNTGNEAYISGDIH